jgi:hypothetical protein
VVRYDPVPDRAWQLFTIQKGNMNRHLTNRECAHHWAHQLHRQGRGSNFYYDGPVIFSYGGHFPIAYLAGHHVYFTRKKYSRTTAKHKFYTLSAISHKRILYVDHVPTSHYEFESAQWRDRVISELIERIRRLRSEFAVAPRKTSLLRSIGEEMSCLINFCQSLDIRLPGLLPEATIDDLSKIYDTWKTLRTIEQLKAMNRSVTSVKEEVEKWHNHEALQISGRYMELLGDQAFLRIASNGKEIETSKGIRVSIDVAKRFWQFVKRKLQTDEKLENCSFIQYRVTEISRQRLVIGCHTISMGEVDYIAQQLHWE